MDENEIIQELKQYLEYLGKYNDFLDWEEERGFVKEDLDSEIDKACEI